MKRDLACFLLLVFCFGICSAQNPLPVACFVTDFSTVSNCNQPVSFDASCSSHQDQSHSIVKYEWDFDYVDVGIFSPEAAGIKVTHVYSVIGTHLTALRVMNDAGQTDIHIGEVTVVQGELNNAPVANAGGPYFIAVGEILNLDGSGSSDPDAGCGDAIVKYEWDLNNDGIYDKTSVTDNLLVTWYEITNYGITQDKQYTIVLRVTDNVNLQGTAIAELTVYRPNPEACFVTDLSTVANCNQTVSFDASCTVHPDPRRSIIKYEWDFNCDGLYFSAEATGINITHSYITTGTYRPALRVTDDAGNIEIEIGKDIMVVISNNPAADAGGPYIIDKMSDLLLDGSKSTDADISCGDRIVLYSWDLDNDDLYDDAHGVRPILTWNELENLGLSLRAGITYIIRLKVLDLTDRWSDPSETTLEIADIDKDGDGISEERGDCNDDDPGIHPGANEECGDGIDQDCNGSDLVCPLPVINCPSNIIVNNNEGQCSASVTFTATVEGTPEPEVTYYIDEMPITSPHIFLVGTTTVNAVATNTGGSVSCQFTVTVTDNEKPVINGMPENIIVNNDAELCSASVNWTLPTAADNCGISTFTSDHSSGEVFPVGTTTVTYTAKDISNNVQTASFTVKVNNINPVIKSIIANPIIPIALGNPVGITLEIPDNNITSIVIDWGNGITLNYNFKNNPAFFSYLYTAAGVYSVKVKITDACGESISAIYDGYIVIYDPFGSFVTGGGWIISPPGSYVLNPLLTGKATFGFESKYQKGKTVPGGNTEFQFHSAGINFKSSTYEWMVVAGMKAMFKGKGTINGSGNYGLLLSAIDGFPDKFRIKIWDIELGGIIYDNQIGSDDDSDPITVISGGSIVIHDAKSKKSIQTPEFGVNAYPNPFIDHIYFDLQLKTDSKVQLEIFNLVGRNLSVIYDGIVVAYDRNQFIYFPENYSSGMLIYRLVVDGQITFTGKLIHK